MTKAEDIMLTKLDALKRLQADTAAELDALLPAILQCSLGFRLRAASPRQVGPTSARAFKRKL